MSRRLISCFAVIPLACGLSLVLSACSVSGGRGIDPRNGNAPIGTVGTNMGAPNAVGVVATPMFFDWVKKTFMPDKRSDVPPPPPPAEDVADNRRKPEQDCTDPSKHPDANLNCR
jgi:hypothetical protein